MAKMLETATCGDVLYAPTNSLVIARNGERIITRDKLDGCRITAIVDGNQLIVGHYGPGRNDLYLDSLEYITLDKPSDVVIASLCEADYHNSQQNGDMRMGFEDYLRYLDDLQIKLQKLCNTSPRTFNYSIGSSLSFQLSNYQLHIHSC